jgi:GH15 family glucan-1,4-alpha-glucosidase
VALPLADYALIGDTETAALVGRDGSIDWLCLPRFDSPACFAALLGEPRHGRWQIAPRDRDHAQVSRRYRDAGLVLETTFRCGGGAVRLVDCMPIRDERPDVVRVVEGLEGDVRMQMELVIRFGYGSIVPWVRRCPDGALLAVGGPDALTLRTAVPVHGKGLTTVAEFDVHAGERVAFSICWHPSHLPAPALGSPLDRIASTERWWEEWSAQNTYQGPWAEAVRGSLAVLKALTYAPTGGMVAAPTASLPETLGGVRNWDYRYCWLRDATFTLSALTAAGYQAEAGAWRDWLLRSIAGDPSKIQIMYGIAGERRLPEAVLDWLPGYAGSRPVRIGNAAVDQLQLDVYGELMDTFHQARKRGLDPEEAAWDLQRALMEFLEGAWRQPDEGLWEVRASRQHFTHSKVMAWVAFDRAVKAASCSGVRWPADRWRALRDQIHADVLAHAWSEEKRSFVQAYGSSYLDASLLLIPQVGFLPPDDPRVRGTVAAIERELVRDGLVLRYPQQETREIDGLPPGDGAFLACSFWLADCYALMGRLDDGRRLFERLLALRNDVGLLSEECEWKTGKLVGNFPQAFSHVGLVNTAMSLTPQQPSPALERGAG